MSNIKIKSVSEILATPGATALLPQTVDLAGWNSDSPVFDRLVAETQPKTIIEVGTWKGRSALHLALEGSKVLGMDEVSGVSVKMPAKVFCVDTWLGGIDHALSNLAQDSLMLDAAGSSRLYYQFLRNVQDSPKLAEYIFPIRNTSLNGARLLAAAGITAQLIYVDGSHEYLDAYADLCSFVQLLAPGGLMFGDDFRMPGVFAAVLRFAHEYGYKIEEVENNFWILRNPSA